MIRGLLGRRRSRLHVVYVACAGDIVSSFEHWCSGTEIGNEGARSYSGEIFTAIRRAGGSGLCLSPTKVPRRLTSGEITAENIGPFSTSGGTLAYYRAWFAYSLHLTLRLWRERPDLVILSDRVIFFPFLLLLRLRGAKIAHVFHTALWNVAEVPSRKRALVLSIEVAAMRWLSSYAFGLHGRVAGQLREKLSSAGVRVRSFLPQWPIDKLREIPVASHGEGPFRIFFIGRIERSKGVFDLLEAVGELSKTCSRPVLLDYFGDGTALEELRTATDQAKLAHIVKMHGSMSGAAVRAQLRDAHLVAVPTRSDFAEGLNKVVIEGLLSGRAVVSSIVCPAVELVPGAVCLMCPDDPSSLAGEIRRLINSPSAFAAATSARSALFEWIQAHRQTLGDGVGDLLDEMSGAIARARPSQAAGAVRRGDRTEGVSAKG